MRLPGFVEKFLSVKFWQQKKKKYFSELPRKNLVLLFIALSGMIAAFLPWAITKVGFFGYAIAVGVHFFVGWLFFLINLAFAIVLLFPNFIKFPFDEAKMPFYTAISNTFLTLVFIIWKLFTVKIGAYIALGSSLLLLFVSIYYKKNSIGERVSDLGKE